MKKSIIYLASIVLVVAFGVSSCDLIGDLLDINFTTGWKDVPFTVTERPAGDYILHEERTNSNLEQEITDNGGDLSNLENVVVDSAYVRVVSPGRTFDAFEWVEVYLSTTSAPTPTLVASGTVGNTGETFVQLDVVAISLNDILAEDSYIVTVEAGLDSDLTEDIDLQVSMRYEVTVGPS